jgi:hypothetical protein
MSSKCGLESVDFAHANITFACANLTLACANQGFACANVCSLYNPQFASVRAAVSKLAVTLPKFRVKHCSSPISFFSTTNTNQKHQKSPFHAWLLVKTPLEPPETPALHHHNLHNGWDYQNDGVSVLIPLQHHHHRLLEDLNQPLNQPLNNNQGVQCLQWHHNPDHTIKKMSPS